MCSLICKRTATPGQPDAPARRRSPRLPDHNKRGHAITDVDADRLGEANPCKCRPTRSATFARYPDPILRLEAKPVRRCDAALAKTVALLRAAARRHGAQGLAATQCGVDAAIVLLGDEAFVNPRIVERSPEARLRCWTERCLALPPDVRVETLRDEAVTVAATTVTGVPFTTTLTGAAARQFSHEYDHARGVLIIDHACDTVASTAFPAMARLEEPFHAERRRRAWDRA